jgi:hypothetical protein
VSEKKAQLDQPPAKGSLMDDILADALAIQDRFVAEPVLKKTGRGVLKSRGVEGLQRDAEELCKRFGHATRPKS